jgi:hypothetical protein
MVEGGLPMNDWKLPWEGGCRCGSVRFQVTKPPMLASACHCTGCQKMSASAFSLSLHLPAEGFEVTKGRPVVGGLNRDMHHFCPDCMSWLFTRPPGLDWLVNLRAPMLDDHLWFRPYCEYWTSEKLPWAATGAAHSFEKVPDLSGFEPLVAQYAELGARP